MKRNPDRDTEARKALTICLRRCAAGRRYLRESVASAMDVGLSKQDVLAIIDERGGRGTPDASLCSVVAIGEAMRYKQTRAGEKPPTAADAERESKAASFRRCLQDCFNARDELRYCVVGVLDAGLSRESVLALIDEIVGGVAEDDISLCGILAVDHILAHEEAIRKEPIDILAEKRD